MNTEVKSMHMRGYGYVVRIDDYASGARVRCTGIARLGGTDPLGTRERDGEIVTLNMRIDTYGSPYPLHISA